MMAVGLLISAIYLLCSFVLGQHIYPYKYLTVSNQLNNPIANNASIIQINQARFTVLTDSLLRLEYSAIKNNPIYENEQTLIVWNRNLTVPNFSKNINTNLKLLTIETNNLLLNYNYSDQYTGFTANNLQIELKSPNYNANKQWKAGDSTVGNLFGTFHTMDTLNGWQNMNCTEQTNWVTHSEPEHCVFGLISTNGYFVLDDSQTPTLNSNNHWVQPQMNGICADNSNSKTLQQFLDINVCFGAGYNPTDKQSCQTAGCCWSENTNENFKLIALNLYWNGNAQDNVASTFEPSEKGYSFVRVIGYIFVNNQSLDINNIYPIKLWYNEQIYDHFTTTTPKDEQNALANNYTFIAQLGYVLMNSDTTKSYYSSNIIVLNLYYSTSRHDHYSDISCQGCQSLYSDQEIQAYILSNNLSCYKRSGNIDWYFFGHGLNYKQAFKDFTLISDKIPIPRKHMLGISWSKWENVNETVIMQQINESIKYKWPMDTYIFDMNWHLKPDWTGYTWDSNLYPSYIDMLAAIHNQNIYIGANLHDAQGVMSHEELYPQMAAANGISASSGETVVFHISNKTYCDTLQSIMLQALVMNGSGFDFWWTDWQQGLAGVTDVTGLSPTIWLNHYRFMNYTQINSLQRGLILSRFGGWGNHRYPVGFGGDIDQTWQSLQFMIYMDSTASNSLFVYWGQEMMKVGGAITSNVELFTRVMQFGALSPIYTNYGNSDENDNLWDLPSPYYNATRNALILRNALFPYRYMLSRIAFDDGLGIIRPMYYDYSLLNDSYYAFGQYMIGNQLLIAPVCTPIQNKTGYAITNVWLPQNIYWIYLHDYNMNTSTIQYVKGGEWIQHKSDIFDIPMYVKEGSIIQTLPNTIAYIHGIVSNEFKHLHIYFYPFYNQINMKNNKTVSSWIYDDDGLTNDYLNDIYSNTSITWNIYSQSQSYNLQKCLTQNASVVRQQIVFTNLKMYKGQSNTRDYKFIVNAIDYDNIKAVQYDGKLLPYCSNNNKELLLCWQSQTYQNNKQQKISIVLQQINMTNSDTHTTQLCF